MDTKLLAPALIWKRVDGAYVATDAAGTTWSIDQHPTTRGRQGKTPDWRSKWWLHRYEESGEYPTDPFVHDQCPLVTSARWTALDRHPQVLRYADALAAGWVNAGWLQGQLATGGHNWTMTRGDDTLPLSEVLADSGS